MTIQLHERSRTSFSEPIFIFWPIDWTHCILLRKNQCIDNMHYSLSTIYIFKRVMLHTMRQIRIWIKKIPRLNTNHKFLHSSIFFIVLNLLLTENGAINIIFIKALSNYINIKSKWMSYSEIQLWSLKMYIIWILIMNL